MLNGWWAAFVVCCGAFVTASSSWITSWRFEVPLRYLQLRCTPGQPRRGWKKGCNIALNQTWLLVSRFLFCPFHPLNSCLELSRVYRGYNLLPYKSGDPSCLGMSKGSEMTWIYHQLSWPASIFFLENMPSDWWTEKTDSVASGHFFYFASLAVLLFMRKITSNCWPFFFLSIQILKTLNSIPSSGGGTWKWCM